MKKHDTRCKIKIAPTKIQGGGGDSTDTSQNNQVLNIQNLACMVDIVCFFALKHEPNWHSDKIRFIREHLQQFCDGQQDLDFLRNRIKSSTHNRPNLQNSISDYLLKFHDEELNSFLFNLVARLIVGTVSDNRQARADCVAFAKQIHIPSSQIYHVLDDILSPEEEPHSQQQSSTHNSRNPEMEAYQLLGVSPNATLSEIKAAYRKRMMDFHPDRNPNITEAVQKILNEQSAKVREAYEFLMKLKGN